MPRLNESHNSPQDTFWSLLASKQRARKVATDKGLNCKAALFFLDFFSGARVAITPAPTRIAPLWAFFYPR